MQSTQALRHTHTRYRVTTLLTFSPRLIHQWELAKLNGTIGVARILSAGVHFFFTRNLMTFF